MRRASVKSIRYVHLPQTYRRKPGRLKNLPAGDPEWGLNCSNRGRRTSPATFGASPIALFRASTNIEVLQEHTRLRYKIA